MLLERNEMVMFSLIDKDKMMKVLNDISFLEYDWNGYGAKSIDNDVIDKAKDLIEILTYEPEIFPTGRNSIQLEYQYYNGNEREAYLEIEVYVDKYTVLIVYENNYQSAFTDVVTDVTKLSSVIQPFFDIVSHY